MPDAQDGDTALALHARARALAFERHVRALDLQRLLDDVQAGRETNAAAFGRQPVQRVLDVVAGLERERAAAPLVLRQLHEIVELFSAVLEEAADVVRVPGDHGQRTHPVARAVGRLGRLEIPRRVDLRRRARPDGEEPEVAGVKEAARRHLQGDLDARRPQGQRLAGRERQLLLPHAQEETGRLRRVEIVRGHRGRQRDGASVGVVGGGQGARLAPAGRDVLAVVHAGRGR